MVTDNVKKLIGLTDYQRERVEEFLEAAKQMKNAVCMLSRITILVVPTL